jgi:signal transduction histidine kinase
VSTSVPYLASILVAWTAVHTFVGVYSLALFSRFQSNALYGGFAGASIGGAIYSGGGALFLMASDVAEAVVGQRLQMVGMNLILAGGTLVLYGLVDRIRHPVVRVAAAWALLGVGTTVAGLTFDPASPTTGPLAWAWPQAQVLPLGVVHAVGALGILLWTIVDVSRRGGLRERDLRLVLLLGLPSVGAWMIDAGRRIMGVPPLFLLEHASVITSVGVSYVLLLRFVRLDDELRQRTRELRRSYGELQAAQDELVRTEQLAAVGELSAVIAHEVRHPLRALERAVGLLLSEQGSATDNGHLLGTLDEETDRLNRLVRDLLAYARPVDPQTEAIALQDLVAQATTLPEDQAAEVRVDIELDDDLPEVHGDPDLLLKAFGNIVDNSLQAMPSGGRIIVRSTLGRIGDDFPAVVLSFRDTGEGMDPLVRERARDPFFTTRPAGTGLGLAIVERVVRAHGGTLDLDSRHGDGTAVTIALPIDRRSSLPPSPPPASPLED